MFTIAGAREVATNGTAPAGRSGAQAVVFDHEIWLFGGYTRKDGECAARGASAVHSHERRATGLSFYEVPFILPFHFCVLSTSFHVPQNVYCKAGLRASEE